MTKEGNTYILIIHDIYGEDADEYCVKAINKAGSRSSRADLKIKVCLQTIAKVKKKQCIYCVGFLCIIRSSLGEDKMAQWLKGLTTGVIFISNN